MSLNQIFILKMIDAVCGRLAVSVMPPPKQSQPSDCQKILIIRPGGIGDAALLVTAINALKRFYPQARVDILAERRNAAVFKLTSQIDNVYLYDRGGISSVLSKTYDVVIDTEQWHRLSAVIARLVRAPVKVGFATNERRRMFTHAVSYDHQAYEADSFCVLLAPLGITRERDELDSPFLEVPDVDMQAAQSLLNNLSGQRYVVIFPGASIVERRWPVSRYHQLAEKLNAQGFPVVIIGGPDDRDAGEAIVEGLEGLNLAGKTSLSGSAAVISQSILLVSGDSGMLHIAVGLGVATVSLFGSGIVAKWGPKGGRHTVINKGLACSPCTRYGYTPSCPYQVKCLHEIGVDEVYAAVMNGVGAP